MQPSIEESASVGAEGLLPPGDELSPSIFKKKLFIYFGCAGSSLLHGHFSSCGEWGLLLAVVCGLLIAVASLVVEHRL